MRRILYLATLLQLVAIIAMIAVGAIHSNRYTYWNFTLSTLFLLFLSYAYWYHDSKQGRFMFKIMTILFFPMVFGSVCFVLVFIMVVLQMDDGWQFLEATIQGGGVLSVGSVHTLDWLIHSGPLVVLLIVLWRVYGIDANLCVRHFVDSSKGKVHYWHLLLYYYVAPLVPLVLYLCFYNPVQQYPTETPLLAIGLAIIFYFIIMTFIYYSLTSQQLSTFHAYLKINQSAPKKKQNNNDP